MLEEKTKDKRVRPAPPKPGEGGRSRSTSGPKPPPVFQWSRRVGSGKVDDWLGRISGASPHLPAVTEKAGASTAVVSVCAVERPVLEPLREMFGGSIRVLKAGDWLHNQERHFVLPVGRRLVVASEGAEVGGDVPVIRIPAGMAFGTGEHATTAMCLRQLAALSAEWPVFRLRFPVGSGDKCQQSNRKPKTGNGKQARVIDAGTGSGVLALAAAQLGAEVEAFDFDPVCLRECRANQRRNSGVPRVSWARADVLAYRPRAKADVLVANLFAGLLVRALPRMRRWLKPRGRMILSGILREQEGEVVAVLRKLGLPPFRVLRKGKWVCLVAGGS
jgi:ribosomal protein L11 methyltransferase